jgi:hypothetical protein
VNSQDPRKRRSDPPPLGQVGRRPPQPAVPLLSGVMWIVVGIVIIVAFTAGWKYVAGIVCIGIGILFLRGGLVALARRDRPRGT